MVTAGFETQTHEDACTANSAEAENLLAAIAAVRRTTRRSQGRPAFLSTLTGSQVELVKLVSRKPGVSVAEAAETLRLAPNTVSTLVGQLTVAGVMVRSHDTGDRRVAQLHLEGAAGRRFADWLDRRTEVIASAMSSLSPLDRHRLVEATAALARLADAFSLAREA